MVNKIKSYFDNLINKKIDVVGMGVSNIPMIKYYLSKGMDITAHDKRDRQDIGESLCESLENMGAKLSLGENYLDDLNGDVIFKSPGMRYDIPAFAKATKNGALLTSEMEVFLDLCKSKNIYGVTGSDGKTTTTTLISKFLEKQGYKVYLGGNIGTPLLDKIEEINEDDYIVLELSSFQLHTIRKSPNVSVITNVAPNHLDMHKSMEEYIEAKTNIYTHQSSDDTLIVNFDNEITMDLSKSAKGNVRYFSYKNKVSNGIYLDGDIITKAVNGVSTPLFSKKDIRIVGEHNVENFMTAICAVWDKVDLNNIIDVAKNFGGVEHRIEFVRNVDGVDYYNSSIDSSPTRTTAALNSFDKKVIVISGGYDKKIPFEPLGPLYANKAKALILMGATKDKIYKAVTEFDGYKNKYPITFAENLEDAVLKAKYISNEGDVIILSPACASFDMFRNFEVRGNAFKRIVNEL